MLEVGYLRGDDAARLKPREVVRSAFKLREPPRQPDFDVADLFLFDGNHREADRLADARDDRDVLSLLAAEIQYRFVPLNCADMVAQLDAQLELSRAADCGGFEYAALAHCLLESLERVYVSVVFVRTDQAAFGLINTFNHFCTQTFFSC